MFWQEEGRKLLSRATVVIQGLLGRGQRGLLLTLCASLVLGAVLIWLGVRTSTPVVIRMGTGPAGGSFVVCAAAVRDVWEAAIPKLKVVPREVEGSIDNLGRLSEEDSGREGSKGIEVGLLTEMPPVEPGADQGIRSLARIGVNPLEIIATRASGIRRLSDLHAGLRVALPPPKTGSARRVAVVLDHFRLREIGLTFVESKNIDDVAVQLRDGKADIAFFGGAMPLPAVVSQLREGGANYRFVSVDGAEGLASASPPFFVCKIPCGAYCGRPAFPDTDIVTIGSYINLVGRTALEKRIGEGMIYKMTEALFANQSYFLAKAPAMAALREESSRTPTGYPLFAGAERYYRRREPFRWDAWTFAVTLGAFVVSVVATAIELRRKKRSGA